MDRVIVIDEENGIYLATTGDDGHLYSYGIGDTHSMTINKEKNNEEIAKHS